MAKLLARYTHLEHRDGAVWCSMLFSTRRTVLRVFVGERGTGAVAKAAKGELAAPLEPSQLDAVLVPWGVGREHRCVSPARIA